MEKICVFCFELDGCLESICGQCWLCQQCSRDYGDLVLCAHQKPILTDPVIRRPFEMRGVEISQEIFKDFLDSYKEFLDWLINQENSYYQNLLELPKELEKHTDHLDSTTRNNRYEVLLKEVTEANKSILKEIDLSKRNLQVLIDIYSKVLKEYDELMVKADLELLTKWCLKYDVDMSEVLPFSEVHLYHVYFYHEESPVDVNTIGFIACSDKIGVKEKSLARRDSEGNFHGRCQGYNDNGEFTDIVYNHGERVRGTVNTQEYLFVDIIEGKPRLMYKYNKSGYIWISIKHQDGYIRHFNPEYSILKSGFYRNEEFICEISEMLAS